MQRCGPTIPPCAHHLLTEEPPTPSECRPRGNLFNLSRGLWALANGTAPQYTARCWLLKSLYHCEDDTRVPKAYEWRWQPEPHCELPRFEPDCAASHFLRGGRSAAGNDVVTVLFLANSLVRQQFESIACRWPGSGGDAPPSSSWSSSTSAAAWHECAAAVPPPAAAPDATATA